MKDHFELHFGKSLPLLLSDCFDFAKCSETYYVAAL